MRSPERISATKTTRAEARGLLVATLACYLAAAACVFAVGHALASLATRDAGRLASAVVAKNGF